MRVLIAGVGNVLRGDDGFGVEVLHQLQREHGETSDVRFFESGIAGITLVQQLLDGYDALIVLDALDRNAEPGAVFVLQPDVMALASMDRKNLGVDLHEADPEGVFRIAAALGVLPPRVWVLGCQAADCDELGAGLSEPVLRAIPEVVRRVYDILAMLRVAVGETHAV